MVTRAESPDRTVVAVFLATVAFGGSNAVAIRVGLQELPPIWSATLRFTLAALILLMVAAVVRPPLPRGRAFLGAVIFGLVGFTASYTFAYLGLVNGGAAVAQVIIGLSPLLTLMFAVALGLESFRWHALAGALLAAAGIVAVSADQLAANAPLISIVLFIAGSVCIAATSVLVKRIPPGHPIWANAIGMGIGGISFAVLSLVLGETWAVPTEPATLVSLLYLVTVGSIALFLAFLYVLSRWTASASSFAILLMPLWTVVVAAIVLGEPIRPAFVLGGALVLAGTYVAAFFTPRPRDVPVCQPPEAAPIATREEAQAPARSPS